MRTLRTFFVLVLFLLGITGLAPIRVQAQTLRPRAASYIQSSFVRGGEITVRITGVQLGTAISASIPSTGITVVRVTGEGKFGKNESGTAVVLLNVASETAIGQYPLRVATKYGISDPIMVVVDSYPETLEREPNNTRTTPGTITPSVAMLGTITTVDDVDIFRVPVKAGETWSVEALAGKIGSPLLPSIRLVNADGREIAFQDSLATADPRLTYTAKTDIEAFLVIRDARFQAGEPYRYRLITHRNAVPVTIFPLGGQPGEVLAVRVTGPNVPAQPITVTLPTRGAPAIFQLPLTINGMLSGPFEFQVDVLATAQESEPNDRIMAANRITSPVIIDGQIKPSQLSNRHDKDFFRISLAKGQVIEAAISAQKLGSRLDSELRILDINGAELARNDDNDGRRDSRLVFTAPNAGEWIIEVYDVSGRGGDNFVYRLSVAPPRQDFALEMVPDSPMIVQGGRASVVINVERLNGYSGEIPLVLSNLPVGVRCLDTLLVPAGQTTVRLTFESTADAPIGGGYLEVRGVGRVAGFTSYRNATGIQEDYTKNGDQIARVTKKIPTLGMAVSTPTDIILGILKTAVSLNAAATTEIPITLVRHGFAGKVTLAIAGLPAGVTASGLELAENALTGTIILKAEGSAVAGLSALLVSVRVAVDELHWLEHSAQPITLDIKK